jgi:hypothetical protein
MSKFATWLLSFAALLVVYPCSSGAQQPNSPLDQATQPGVRAVVKVECDDAAVLDAKGNVVFPAGATEIEEPVYVDQDQGQLSALYPSLDTTTDGFYPLPCEPSIGGTLPAEVNDQLSQTEIDAENYLSNFETKTVEKIVDKLKLDTIRDLGLGEIEPFKMGDCFIKYQWAPKLSIEYKIPCDN